MSRASRWLLTAGLLGCWLGFSACWASPQAEQVLWLWERPEDLRFLSQEAQPPRLALLVATLHLHEDRVEAQGRRHPLALPPGIRPFPVVRIEAGPRPRLDLEQRRQVVEILAQLADPTTTPTLQIDFDATVSQRAFYRAVLVDLANSLPPRHQLSITALVSWCRGDFWLADLPIVEAIPMLFRMGAEAEETRRWLAQGNDFAHPICRHSYGLATDEPSPPLEAKRRRYYFHPRGWTSEAWARYRL